MHQKLIPGPFLILLNNPKQPLDARNSFTNRIFWKRIIKKLLKKITLFFFRNACYPHFTQCHSYVMSFVCHSYVFLCQPYVTRMYSYVTRVYSHVVCMSLVCHWFVLVFHPYVTRLYSYVIRMSLLYTRMSSVCHAYILVCHPYVTGVCFYHEPTDFQICIRCTFKFFLK